MSKPKKPIIAIMYDFDKTLSTKDMQEYGFIPNLGISSTQFWNEVKELKQTENMDPILAYMRHMLKKASEKSVPVTRDTFVALGKDIEKSYWKRGFIRPVEGRISGKFGGQRIMNGKKMNPHAGMDIAAPEGTDVKAAGDAIVTLTADNLFYSGNVVILDHGAGLQTIYAHLSKMEVTPGQKVKKGEVIGKVGKTGRVTGPHLHWGASLKGVKFNPESLLSLTNNNDFCFIL